MELTARMDFWSLGYFGPPIDGYILVGRVAGHNRLTDGNMAATSKLRFLSEDLTYAYTSSQGRRYILGPPAPMTCQGLRMFASLTIHWRLPDETLVRAYVEPSEIAGRQLDRPDA